MSECVCAVSSVEMEHHAGADPRGVDWVSSHPPMDLKCRRNN